MPTISTIYRGDMAFETQLGNHRLVIDVPPTMGGHGRGPIRADYAIRYPAEPERAGYSVN